MARSRFSIIVFCVTFGFVVTGAMGASLVKGVVEYSFDRKYRLIQAKNFVYLVKADHLNREMELQFERVGSQISIELPPDSIANAWPITPFATENANRVSDSVMAPDSINADGKMLTLTGTVLPATSENDRFVQIGRNIFHVNVEKFAASERQNLMQQFGRATIHVPADSIGLVWTARPEDSGREPASVNKSEPEHFDLSDDWLSVTGIARYSFNDGMVEIQSGDTFFSINRLTLTKVQQDQASIPGNHVTLRVPAEAISMIWSQSQ